MYNATDTIAFFERFGNLIAKLFNNNGIVASNSRSGISKSIIDVLLIIRIDPNCMDLDEHLIIAQLRHRHLLDGSLALLLVDDSFGSHRCCECYECSE